jgi:hypothetical protein
MWFRLALALGHKSVKEAQKYIDSREFNQWIAYYLLEPFGPRREDQRFGVVAATIANVNRKKGAPPFKWDQFFPEAKLKKEQSWEDMLRVVTMLNEAMGGEDRRAKKKG